MSGWFHVVFGTKGSWLPGDPRGFRSRNHRIHSSGDYRNPPQADEHAGLRRHAESLGARRVMIPPPLRRVILDRIVAKAGAAGIGLAAASVSALHVHMLVSGRWADLELQVGRLKQASSHAVRQEMPGAVWAGGSGRFVVRDDGHFCAVVSYIADHAHEGAAVTVAPRWAAIAGPVQGRAFDGAG